MKVYIKSSSHWNAFNWLALVSKDRGKTSETDIKNIPISQMLKFPSINKTTSRVQFKMKIMHSLYTNSVFIVRGNAVLIMSVRKFQ